MSDDLIISSQFEKLEGKKYLGAGRTVVSNIKPLVILLEERFASLQAELAEYKERFESQMVQIRLHDKAVEVQAKTYDGEP